jgi:hypothetical protein
LRSPRPIKERGLLAWRSGYWLHQPRRADARDARDMSRRPHCRRVRLVLVEMNFVTTTVVGMNMSLYR